MELVLALLMGSLGSIGSTAVAGFLILRRTDSAQLVPALVSFATGTLLTGATVGLLPEAFLRESPAVVGAGLLGGLAGFFLLESLLVYRHRHEGHGQRGDASAFMILVGDGVHNLTDGIVIGAAFVISVPLGISVGLAVAAHEVPQELADFGILLDGGFRPKKALWANLVSATPTIPGAALGYLAGDAFQGILWIFMVISAASFLYIGLADLVPKIHGRPTGAPLGRMGLLLLGGGLIAAIHYGFS